MCNGNDKSFEACYKAAFNAGLEAAEAECNSEAIEAFAEGSDEWGRAATMCGVLINNLKEK